MRSFKEQLTKDFDSTFFNLNEFAEEHSVNGTIIPIVTDSEMIANLKLGKNDDTDGIFTDDIVIFVLAKYMEYEPISGQIMELDRQSMIIKSVMEDYGGYTIVLSSNES